MIRILTDSASDMTTQELAALGVEAIPMSIHFGADCYQDGVDLRQERFYELLQTCPDFPQTSQPSPADFEQRFAAARAAGDEMVVILVSSALSGTFQGAHIAKTMDDYDNIYLVDSLSATAGERLLVLEAVRLREAGASAADIAAALENLKGRIRIWAGLDTLEYLQKGGRLSRTAAEIGTIAHMKPVVAVTQTGEVTVVKKCIGRRRAIEQVEKLLLATPPDPNFPLFTLYAHERENCEQLNERLRATSITPTASVNIGPTIGTHIGIGACGVAYIAKE